MRDRFLTIIFLVITCLGAEFAIAQSTPQDENFDATFSADTDKKYTGALQSEGDTSLNFDLPDDLQKDFPQQAADIRPERRERRSSDRSSRADLGFMGPVFEVIFWVLLALVGGFIIISLLREVAISKRNFAPKVKADDGPAVPIYQVDEETARVLMDDADKLALDGKYEDAVHMLLFRSIQDIADKRPHYVRRSLTAREISGLPVLSEKARASFSAIGALVERSFFGGAALGDDDYQQAKSAYKDFAFEKIAK